MKASSGLASTLFHEEYHISYSKISVTAGVAKTLGVSFTSYDMISDVQAHMLQYPYMHEAYKKPNLWGSLTSGDPFFWHVIPEIPLTMLVVALMLAAVLVYRSRRRPYLGSWRTK